MPPVDPPLQGQGRIWRDGAAVASVRYVVTRFETSTRNVDVLECTPMWLGEVRFNPEDEAVAVAIFQKPTAIELEFADGHRIGCRLLQQDSGNPSRWTVSLGENAVE
jgi:hypothetical protein